MGLFDWHGGVTLDHGGRTAALRLDRKSERSHVEEKNVLHIALEHPTLNRSTDGDHFVRINALGWVLFEVMPLQHLEQLRDTGRSSYENHFVDISCVKSSCFECSHLHGLIVRCD